MARFPSLFAATALIFSVCAPQAIAAMPLCKGGSSAPIHASHGTFERIEAQAEAGNINAQNQLGVLFYRGSGVPRDYVSATHWWHRAADRGHATAQCNLGLAYLYGRGIGQDDVLAYYYFNLAAARGLRDARWRRNMMEAWRLSPSQLEAAQSMSRGQYE